MTVTMPNLMNCEHDGEGWCLSCVIAQNAEVVRLNSVLQAIVEHHDYERKSASDDNDYDNARYHEERRNVALMNKTPNV